MEEEFIAKEQHQEVGKHCEEVQGECVGLGHSLHRLNSTLQLPQEPEGN